MSSDRALLEAAAGVFGVPAREEGGYMFAAPNEISASGWGIVTWMGYGTVQFWNPLESNDDAFRLAVQLNLQVLPDNRHSTPHTRVERRGLQCVNVYEVWNPDDAFDAYTATRRAITRAAAAMAPHQEKAE